MQQTTKAYLTSLSIIHTALIMGQLLFAGVTFYLNNSGQYMPDKSLNTVFMLVVPGLVIVGIVASNALFSSRIKNIKEKQDFSAKLEAYRSVSIMRWALLEGPSLFAIICYFLTGNNKFLLMAGILIVIFVLKRPSKDKLVQDLELNQAESVLI